MSTIAESLSASERTFAAGIAADREAQAAKRDALVSVSGHLNWQGQPCLPCPRCSRVFLATSLRRLHTPGADDSLVCRKCADQAIAALGYHDH